MQLKKIDNLKDYYDYCNTISKIKGAMVITKDNYLFYGKISNNDDCSHTDICRAIEKDLGVTSQEDNIYGYTEYDCLCIDFVKVPVLTKTQYQTIKKILSEVCSIDKDITISIYYNDGYKEFNNKTLIKINRYINEKVKCKCK